MSRILRHLTRKRPLDPCITSASQDEEGEAKMEKCLTTFDLISLGVGSCCGAGMYLTAGIIAAQKAGPGGVVSIFLAGLGSMLTGFHYAELAGICPHTSGSAYMYTYVTVGEFSAFVIGWGLIVEYVIGTSAAAVALSATFHSITENRISTAIDNGLDHAGLPHIDVVAAVVCLLLTWLLATGVQMSARVNNILNGLNCCTWIVFVIASLCLGSSSNWSDHGGFLPFGYTGVLSAIPTAYYAFVGFDGLATTGAECKDPSKSIPVSILMSVLINILVFTSVVAGLTFDVPYNLLPPTTATMDVFLALGYPALKYVMAAGAVSGLFAATFGSLFPLPRVLQAMAHDGLIFRYFAHVCPKRHTALRATLISGIVATLLAAFVDLTLLIELVLIGTLLSYVIVTFATLVIRFVNIDHVNISANARLSVSESAAVGSTGFKRKASDCELDDMENDQTTRQVFSRQASQTDTDSKVKNGNLGVDNKGYLNDDKPVYPRNASASSVVRRYDDFKEISKDSKHGENESSFHKVNEPSFTPILLENSNVSSSGDTDLCKSKFTLKNFVLYLQQHVCAFLLSLYGAMFVISILLSKLSDILTSSSTAIPALVLLAIIVVSVTGMAVMVMFIPQISGTKDKFRAPLVPLITIVAAAINIFLMASLSLITWLLFLAWLLIGLSIYFLYGRRYSLLNLDEDWDEPCDAECTEKGDVQLKLPNTRCFGKETSPLLH